MSPMYETETAPLGHVFARRQVAPLSRRGPAPSAWPPGSGDCLHNRRAGRLRAMDSFRAASGDDGAVIETFAVLANPAEPGRYFERWGRWGDFGVIAETGGEPSGAAWARLFSWRELRDRRGSPEVPEIAIAVEQAFRGRGLGTALLRELMNAAGGLGYPALDLSVSTSNRAALAVYTKLGFKKVSGEARLWMRATIGKGGACAS